MAVAELMRRIKALIPQRPFAFAKRHAGGFRGAGYFVIEFVDASVIDFSVVNYMRKLVKIVPINISP